MKPHLTKLQIYLLSASIVLIPLVIAGRALAAGESLPSAVWDFIFGTAKDNLGSFLLGGVVASWYWSDRIKVDERVEYLEDVTKANNVLLRRICVELGVKFSAEDIKS